LTTASGSFSIRISNIEGNYATTGSNVFMGAQTVCANITSTGTIIAQTINVQQVTSSIVYSSGSNIFGNLSSDVQQMTGSVRITGSLNTTGTICSTGNTCFGGMSIVTSCLGIGTQSPSEALHLYGTGISPRPALFIETCNASATPEIRLFQTSGRSVLMNLQTNGDLSIQNSTNNSSYNTRMTIVSCGNVGIAILAPVDRLHVCGNIISEGCFFSGAPDNLRIFAGHWSTVSGNTNCYLVLQAGGGNVSFGTPQGWGGTAAIYTCGQNRLTINSSGIAYFSSTVCTPMLLASGCVGIGYTTPTVKLQVSGTIATGDNVTGWGRFSYDTATNQVRIQASKDGTDSVSLSFYTQASGGGFAERMVVSGSNVGIGTCSPSDKLHVQGADNGITICSIAANRPVLNFINGSTSMLKLSANGIYGAIASCTGDVMFFYGNNVGIGTTSPSQKLSVDGGNIILNGANASANYYLLLNKKTGQDGGILFQRDNANDWQFVNDATNGNLQFYSYGIGSTAVTFQKSTGGICFLCPVFAPAFCQPAGFTVYSFNINYGAAFSDISSGNYLSIGGTEPGTINNYCAYAHGGISPRAVAGNTEGMTWTCLRFVLRALSPVGNTVGTATYLQTAGYFYNTGFYGICTCVNISGVMDGSRGYSTVVLPWIPFSSFQNSGDVTGFGIRNVGPTTVRIGSIWIQYK